MKKININKFFKETKFDFAKNLKYFIIAPLVLIATGIILLFTVNFNLGIDFTGGTIVNVILGEDIETDEQYNVAKNKINEVLQENGLTASIVQKTETDKGLAISVRYQDKNGITEEQMNDLNDDVQEDLLDAFNLNPEIEEEASKIQNGQRIGSTASSELLTNAFLSLLIVVAIILIYIAFRFELTSGLAAILALFHDVIIMCCLVMIFRVQINSSFIAAVITIVGYSINNTIIIFDRIRENGKKEEYQNTTNRDLVNLSIKETLTRTLYTTITTFVTIGMLTIFGVASIREFALPIIFGLIAGTYSSIFIAPGLWAMAYRKKNKKKIAKPVEIIEN